MTQTLTAKTAAVFVVDDDPDVRRSVADLLQSDDLPVRAFDCGQAFLEAADPEWCGCVLVDVRMPRISGLEVLEEMNRRGLRLPAIILTGHGDVPTAVRALRSGANDFLEKPYNPRDLLDRVHRALACDAERRAGLELRQQIESRLAALSQRERQVMERVIRGEPNKSIAAALGITIRTVEVHRARMMAKLGCEHITELVRMLVQVEPPG